MTKALGKLPIAETDATNGRGVIGRLAVAGTAT